MDADDEWMPNYLETVYQITDNCDDDVMIITGRFQQNLKTRFRTYNIPKKYSNRISEIKFFENPHVYVHISATTINADVLKKILNSGEVLLTGRNQMRTSHSYLKLHCT